MHIAHTLFFFLLFFYFVLLGVITSIGYVVLMIV